MPDQKSDEYITKSAFRWTVGILVAVLLLLAAEVIRVELLLAETKGMLSGLQTNLGSLKKSFAGASSDLRQLETREEALSRFRKFLATKKHFQMLATEPPIAEIAVTFKELIEVFHIQEGDPKTMQKKVISAVSNVRRQGDIVSTEPPLDLLEKQVDTEQITGETTVRLRFVPRLIERE